MTHDQFWSLIADSRSEFDPNRRGGNMDLQVRRLRAALLALPADGVAAFDDVFTELFFAANTWDLWAAAFIMNEGCSDDGFMDFRYWLISMGRRTFELAVADADSLADVVDLKGIEVFAFEDFGGVVTKALQAKGVADRVRPTPVYAPSEPAGEEWDEDDLPERLPRLWAKCNPADA